MDKGFSLIELIVVIGIVALLAAIAVPSYKTYQYKTKVALAGAAVDQINNALITSYMSGLWNCSSTAFTYKGVTHTVDAGAATSQFAGLVDWIQIQHAYGTFGCSDGTIATFQYNINAANLPPGSGTELVCIIQDKGAKVIKKCGVWDGAFPWQPSTAYLPPGFDCLLSTNLTVRGTACN